MAFTGPSIGELRESADRLGLAALGAEAAEAWHAAMRAAVAAIARLDALPDPVLREADTAARPTGRAATPDENPYGAWAWLATITGAAGKGLLAGKTIGIKDNTLAPRRPCARRRCWHEDCVCESRSHARCAPAHQ